MTEARPRILLLDDEDNIRSSVSTLLEEEGYEVLEASSLRQGREWIRNEARIDCAILDRRVGTEVGTDLVIDLRARYPRIPIIILSGSSSVHEIPQVDLVIDKLESPRALLDQIAKLIGDGP